MVTMEVKQLRELYETVIYVLMQANYYAFAKTDAGWLEDFKTYFAKGHQITYNHAAYKLMPIYNTLVPEAEQLTSTYMFNYRHGIVVLNYLEKEGIIQWDHSNNSDPEMKLTNFEAPRKIFEETKYLLSTYKGSDGRVRAVRIKDFQEGAALFAFLRDPDAYDLTPAAGNWLNSEILPKDVQSRKKILSPETKKKFSMRTTVSDHFAECMKLITGQDMRWCLGIRHITNPMTWTPTRVEDTDARFEIKIDEILKINQASHASYQQINLLKKLYHEHGKGTAFLNWAAQQVEDKLMEDPGKYISHKVFGAAAKAMLACS
jgi:hypothetical protein